MLRILLGSAILILIVVFLLQAVKFYLRKHIRKGRVISVFVPPPWECAIYGLRFQVIGDLQISINLEGASKQGDRMLYAARPLEGNVWHDLYAPIRMTGEDSLVVRRHFGTGTIVGFIPVYRSTEDVEDPAHGEFVEGNVS